MLIAEIVTYDRHWRTTLTMIVLFREDRHFIWNVS